MSTRAMICVDWYGHGHYELFYRHCDGHPRGLGMELLDAMLKYESIEEVIKEVGATPQGRTINKPEDAFLKVQSDLEWIYVIRNGAHSDTMSLQIYKTSYPYTKRNFVWPVWFSYRTYMKRKRALPEMSMIELAASNTLHALHEFEKAKPAANPEQSGAQQKAKQVDSMTKLNGKNVNSHETNAQQELARYAACVFEPGDVVEVRRLPCGESTWHQAGRLAEVAESLLADNQHQQHIYVGANPRRSCGGTRSKDVACGRCLFVDFDGIGPDAAQDRWRKVGFPPPTLMIASGHGVHAYWRILLLDHQIDLSDCFIQVSKYLFDAR